jgi:hypothetical protein
LSLFLARYLSTFIDTPASQPSTATIRSARRASRRYPNPVESRFYKAIAHRPGVDLSDVPVADAECDATGVVVEMPGVVQGRILTG